MSAHAAAEHGSGPSLYGLVAEFETVEAVLRAAERVREAGFTRFDVHSPIPIHGLDEAMGIRMSRLPWVAAAGGAAGACAALLLQWWTNAIDYPYIISGKPFFGLPANIPVTFELTVLLASVGAVFGMLISNGLPQLYHPLFRVDRFRRATSDRFFVSIEASDPRFDPAQARALLVGLGSVAVEDVEA